MIQYSQEAALDRQIKYQNSVLIHIRSGKHIYDFLANVDLQMMQTMLYLLVTILTLHHIRRLVVNDIDVNHPQDSIEDIMETTWNPQNTINEFRKSTKCIMTFEALFSQPNSQFLISSF